MQRHILYASSPGSRALVERAEELIASARFRPYKAEGRTLAGMIEGDGHAPAFLKRTTTPSWVRGLIERIRGSRASRSLRGAGILAARGIPHPATLAALDAIQWGAIRASYLASEYLADADTLSRFALGPGGIKGRDVRRRKRISDAVARAVRRLHDSGIYTRDLQETNVMVRDDGAGGYQVYFVDLEDFRRARTVSWRRRMLNLVHLDRSIGRFLCRAARLDFLYAYLGARPGRAEARRRVAEILSLKAKVARRARRRSGTIASEAAGVRSDAEIARGGSRAESARN
ncbi:MAG TPA: lipopolysaccharide kinase InaA family protein [Candidatus Binataceae bacterium]|nr:lipopolysaccharide kinase InaA family protein [Candidatus Binataceae bacterium]